MSEFLVLKKLREPGAYCNIGVTYGTEERATEDARRYATDHSPYTFVVAEVKVRITANALREERP